MATIPPKDARPVRPIIIKKVKKVVHGHHGGAWKIAYADFVTAMMAFFLLMWLLGSTTDGDKKGIAEYFQNPLKVSMSGGSGAGDATSVIKGGGNDVTQSAGQVAKGDGRKNPKQDPGVPPIDRNIPASTAADDLDRKRLERLKAAIAKVIEQSKTLRAFKDNILLDITSEGLRIQIVDDKARPMFDVNGTSMKAYTQQILWELVPALDSVDNRLSIAGHTDSRQYAGGEAGRSNWELSTERASAARRELVDAGLSPGKVLQVRGLADVMHLRPQDPMNPENRRISITLLNNRTVKGLLQPEAAASEPAASPPGAGT